MIGQTISHYQILEKLGEGGMGVVYKARDTKLDRTVALKFLSASVASGSEEMERFIQEARSAAALNHPNICTIYGIEESDGKNFIAMEFVEGQTLQEKKSSLNVKQALDIGMQAAEGLAAAHEKGIVHRDIKPENIMIRRDGRVQIMDFGLAKLRGASRLTREGSTVGTVGYMSPEQVQGQDTDHRTDIFSLGVLLYEMFAGQSPFKGVHETAIIYEIVNVVTPPISVLRPDIDPELERLILECLEKEPADRCQSAAELARNLKRLKRESTKSRVGSRIQPVAASGDSAGMKGRSVTSVWRTATIVLAVLFAGTIATLSFKMSSGSPAVDLSSYRYTPFEVSGDVYMGRWSPDGKSVAYLRNTEGSNDLMVRSLDNPRSTKLATLGEVSTLFWAPDGEGLYFTSGGRLQTIGLAGGAPDTLLPFRVQTAAISPDNRTIAISAYAGNVDSTIGDTSTVFITTPAGDFPRRYMNDDFKYPGGHSPTRMQFSPDGSKIALAHWGDKNAEFWILPWPDGGDKRPRKIFTSGDLRNPPVFSWLPDSRRVLLTHEGGMWIGDTDDETLVRITSSAAGEGLSSVSPDGRRILFTVGSNNSDVVELPFDGSPLKPLKATSIDEWSGTTSAEGNSMAYITTRSGKSEIWLEEGGGAGHPIVTRSDFPADDSAGISMAILSPDGKRVVYHRPGRQSLRTLWLSNAEGGKPLLMFPDRGWLQNPCWSPDGKRLYISLRPGDSTMNLIVPIGAGDTVHLPDSAWSNGLPAWSPDGKWIALQQSGNGAGTGKDRIILMSPDGKMTRTLDSPVRPSAWGFCMAWSRDSKTIYIASSTEKTSRLDAVDVATGKSRKIADYGYDINFGQGTSQMSTASLSADGKGLIVTAQIQNVDLCILDGALEAEK